MRSGGDNAVEYDYDIFDHPTAIRQRSGDDLRTNQYGYDALGRTSSTIATNPGGGRARPRNTL